MDETLFEYLLSMPEVKVIDFKKDTYDFSKNKDAEDAKLVKDILSFSNTIRNETAYIIAGVTINKGVKTLNGISGMLDDASLQEKVKDKIQPRPHFVAYDFPYQGKIFGIIEIPVRPHAHPLWSTVDIKGCKPSKVYHRLGTSNTEANADEIIAINDWLKQLRDASLPPPVKPLIEQLDNYIPRTVSPADGDPIAQFLLDHDSLETILTKHKRVALLGWGLSGKSTELKRLAQQLSLKEELYVYLIPFNNHVNEAVVTHIPHIDRINPNNIVVLLDGLDEVLPSEFDTARRHISQFVKDYPATTVVVSCRTNFYVTDPDDSGLGTLNNFQSYRLDNLDQKTIDSYLDENYPKDKSGFLKEVKKKNLLELLTIPYYLVKLAKQFNLHHQIVASKAELFQSEIKELIAKDIAKLENTGREIFEQQLFDLFKKLAFIMEAKGTNTISTMELASIFSDKNDFRLVINAGSIFWGTDSTQKTWKFNHNNTQEYLAARVLTELPFKKIKKIIGNKPDHKRIKPSWVNTLSFLNSILPTNATLKQRITKWMVKYNLELAIMLEPENITDDFRCKVFCKIFNDFKRKKRYINRNIYKIEDLAKFSESAAVFEYLLNELKSVKNIPSTANALNIINHFSLSRFTKYKDAFKPFYRDFLLGDQQEFHYLALIGYVSLFDLSKEEFKVVFEKFRDSEDTWIRYQLFTGIWLTNNQDDLIFYLIEQARFLMKEDRQEKRRNNKELRLSNENQEIANALQRISSPQAIAAFFSEMKDDFLNFKHSVYFDKIFDNALENAAKYACDVSLTKAIDDVFFKHHTYILHDNKLKILFFHYYQQTDRTNYILQNLYSFHGLKDYSIGYTISAMADAPFIDYLSKEFAEGRINADTVDMLVRFMERNEQPNEAHFREAFKLGTAPIVVARDFKKEEQITKERNLAALFDKDIYVSEIQKIFNSFGKSTLSYEDRYSHTGPDFWGNEFCEVARDVLDLHPNAPDAVLSVVLENIERNFDNNFINLLYDYVVKHSEITFTDEQRKRVVDWCDMQVKIVDFKQAITGNSPFEWTWSVNAQMLSFFIRLLNLTNYDEHVYLDMLSFIKNGDNLSDITLFVHETLGFEKTKGRILANLNAGINNSQVLKSHVEYLIQHELSEAVDLLIPYFSKENGDQYQLLKGYIDLGGDIEKLYPILDKSDIYFRNSLIEQFLRSESSIIVKYLKKKFKSETDIKEKLTYARYLIRLQDDDGLRYYLDYLTKNKIVPDDSSPGNPLYSLRKKHFTSRVLDLYELSQEPEYHSDSFYDLRNISATALQNIALNRDNFPNVKRKIKRWIVKRKLLKKKKIMPTNLIKDIEYFLENFSKQFYITRVVMLTQKEAIELYEKLTSLK